MNLLKLCATALLVLLHNIYLPPDPVHFTFAATPVTAQPNTFELHFSAKMDHGWHIYAKDQPAEAIAIPTKVTFTKNPLIVLKGEMREVGEKEKYTDLAAGITQFQYGEQVDLVQTVQLKAKSKTTCNGSITYQACTDEMCLPPKTIAFSLALP